MKNIRKVIKIKIDWKRKLTSRKFWIAVAAVAIAIMTLLHYEKIDIEQMTIIVSAIGGIITYILAEAGIDKKNIK